MRKINRPACPNPQALRTNYKHQDNKKALINASYGKCMYCESFVLAISFGDVEHIKPKSKFPSLEFEWSNLGFVCTSCNNAKRDKFDDSNVYINPYDEDPSEHFLALGPLLKHKNGSERGEMTIIDIALNRSELIEKRQNRINDIQKAIDACLRTHNITLRDLAVQELLKEASEDKEYSFFVRTVFILHGLL